MNSAGEEIEAEAADEILVSVIVPVRNEAAHGRYLRRLVTDQRLDGRAEFLFVEGRSEDGTRSLLGQLEAELPDVRVLDNPRQNIPDALNIGLREARGEFVARMDSHTLYPPTYLAAGIARLRRGGASWVSGPQVAAGADPGSRRVAAALSTPLGIGGAGFRRPIADEIETDSGYTGVWRRDTLVELGGWSEGWNVNEDGELAARLRSSGGRILCVPEMAAHYIPRSTLRGLARQYLRYGVYRAKTAKRHPDSLRSSHLLPLGLLAVLLLAGPRSPACAPARAGLSAYVLALALNAFAGRGAASARDVIAMPFVLLTMHLCWAAGFALGAAQAGMPLAALVKAVRGLCP